MIAYLLVFCYYPMYGVTLAFKEFNFSKGILGSPWAKEYGFYNFMRLFRDPSFITAFTNTLLISAGRLIFEFPVPIVLSLLINEIRSTKYKRVVQTIYTFPHFISWIIVAGLFFNLFSNDGIVNQFLLLLGLERQTIDELIAFVPWFKNPETGETRYPSVNFAWSETYLSSSVDDAKAERCMALMDFLLSDEGYEYVGLGIEGETYTKNADGSYSVIELTKPDGSPMSLSEKYPATQLQTLANWTGFRSASSPMYSDGLKKLRADYMAEMEARGAAPTDRPNTDGLILEETSDYNTAGNDYEKICNDLMLSDDVEAAWKEMVDSYMAQGYDKVIAEMNKLYKESGR